MGNELLSTPQDSQQLHDQRTRHDNEVVSVQNNTQTTNKSIPAITRKTSSNSVSLSAGDHSGLVTNKLDTNIVGIGDCVLKSTVKSLTTGQPTFSARLEASSRFSNVRFIGDVFLLTAGITGIFENCVFDGSIACSANTNSHYIGCVFNSTTTCLAVDGAAAAFVIGCSRPNGGVHVGAPTIIAETT